VAANIDSENAVWQVFSPASIGKIIYPEDVGVLALGSACIGKKFLLCSLRHNRDEESQQYMKKPRHNM